MAERRLLAKGAARALVAYLASRITWPPDAFVQ
jgi:hypothetical protein